MEFIGKNAILAILSILFLGCSAGEKENKNTDINVVSTTKNKSQFDESLRGSWLYVDSGKVVYLDEDFNEEYEKIDGNHLAIERSGTTYHLIRKGINTTVVKGSVYAESFSKSAFKGVENIGDIDIVLEHAKDRKNRKRKKLDRPGKFEIKEVISGEYVLTAEDELSKTRVSAIVDIYGEEITLGNFKLVSDDGYNFKGEFVINNSDNGYLYGNLKQYTGKLKIKNIGSKKGKGLNYSFDIDSSYVESFTDEIVLGTVDVNESIEIPFSLTCNILDKSSITLPLNIKINDVDKHEWLDTVFFHIYQTPMKINIAAKESNVKGYIIVPGHDLVKIDTQSSTIMLPYIDSKQYTLVLANPNVNSETPYSIGIDVPAQSFEGFRDTSSLEPNDKESDATSVFINQSIVSYLHEGDIDYFTIDMSPTSASGQYSPPTIPFK